MNLREREHKRKAKETKTFFVEGKRKKREKKKQKCFYRARESYRDTEDKGTCLVCALDSIVFSWAKFTWGSKLLNSKQKTCWNSIQ